MKLYNYFRSSTSFRVRIALNLKGLDFEYLPLHLRHGEQRSPDYLARNPQGLVPSLEVEAPEGTLFITQSLAIVEYLEECHPEPPLLPADPAGRARVRAIAYAIACDLHPLNNLRVLTRLTRDLGLPQEAQGDWFRHWVAVEFAALESRLAAEQEIGRFCHGDRVSLADICLVPQVVNGRRFDCDMAPYPTIRRIFETCMEIPAFARAAPQNQPDAE